MSTCRLVLRVLVCVFVLGAGASLYADWNQWAHDPQHTGFTPDIIGQPVDTKLWSLVIDNTIPPSGDFLAVHYASPLIDGATNMIYMTEKERIGTIDHRRVMALDAGGNVLCKYETDYVPPPSSWEPVFHPVLANGYLYVPGARGTLHIVDPSDCREVDIVAPYPLPEDPPTLQQLLITVFVAGVPSVDDVGNIYYPMLARAGAPMNLKSLFVMITTDGTVTSASYDSLAGMTGARPPLNAGAAISPDGTIYTGGVKPGEFNREGYLLAINPDLTVKWRGNMSADPIRRGYLLDQSSSCPVVGPDGRVFYGGWNSNGGSQGYLYSFSPDGKYLGNFEFGWDTTPAIYPDPDGDPGHYHLVQEYNRYDDRRYYLVSLDPNTLQVECQWELVDRRWGVHAPMVDAAGAVYMNGEDGYLYRLTDMYPAPDGRCNPQMTRIFLAQAREAANTPLSVDQKGMILTLNNGSLFAVGAASSR